MAKDWKESEHPRDEKGRFEHKQQIEEMRRAGYNLSDFHTPDEVAKIVKELGLNPEDHHHDYKNSATIQVPIDWDPDEEQG